MIMDKCLVGLWKLIVCIRLEIFDSVLCIVVLLLVLMVVIRKIVVGVNGVRIGCGEIVGIVMILMFL